MFQSEVIDKVTGQCPQTTAFEEKGEAERNETDGLTLTVPVPNR